ncbi:MULTISPECIES: GGDEF domain-containing protein [unclassified Marinobacter]|jgi:diguanylate cyclase|uniref:GGDEF domain-containing protein n=1 Tax=Marinobacter TaxID=2742 RepID=UPI00069FF72F|nr:MULTISPECIES: GGDEF domain-containing protein [unclassified Marinobacter]AKV96887.1 diguanylate cyclase [Marinobacter sp. CP1]HBX39177.1 GGDEF domain-containing protein [Marinobacter adhaerens]
MASDQSWKEKYLQELESADNREKQWKAERNTLERMLVRTSLASEGQTPELDRLLARIRKDLRKNRVDVDAWKDLQDQIDRQVALLDERQSANDRKPSFFSRLAREPEQEPQQQQQQVSAEPLPESSEQPESLPGNDQDVEDNVQRLRIARRVGQLLGQMLTQVSLEPAAEARARALQQSLLASNDWDELREGLNHVAELVIAAVTRSKREFEAFLKRLDERLELLREHFSAQSSAQSGRLDASEHLDREIREEIERVGQRLQESDDLQDLKQSVSRHLESIGQAVGRFRTQESERERALSEQLEAMQEKVAAMEAHSEQMQEQVRKERLRAMTDLLTELPNREAWQERLSFEYNRWQRYSHPLTIGVLDIDLFKRINDSYGHKAGDRVLQLVAREFRDRLRTTDFVARFGGEEFVVLFPETEPSDARAVVDKLREHVGKLPFHFRGEPVTVTFSAGLAGFIAGDTEESVFDRADRALYQAKDAGRDQVMISDSADVQ